jgi:GH43 family beta-xylosidase
MNGKWYFIAHAYDKNVNGASKLYIREIEWKDGWPLITDRNPAK